MKESPVWTNNNIMDLFDAISKANTNEWKIKMGEKLLNLIKVPNWDEQEYIRYDLDLFHAKLFTLSFFFGSPIDTQSEDDESFKEELNEIYKHYFNYIHSAII